MRGKDLLTALNIKALREEIAHYCTLGARVIDQAQRRVLDGEHMRIPGPFLALPNVSPSRSS